MAAIGLAVIGKNNEPLYVQEFLSEHETEEDEAVLFGLKPLSTNSIETQTVSGKCWFALHAALDRLEQLTKTLDNKKKTIQGGGGKNNNFVGLLLPLDATRVYGYLTNSHIKIVVLVEDEGPNEAEATEFYTRQLLEEIHELYVREIMNPFYNNHVTTTTSKGGSKTSNRLSPKFDERVRKVIADFNKPETRYSVAEC